MSGADLPTAGPSGVPPVASGTLSGAGAGAAATADLIAVVGATGTGKSDLGIAIAERLRAAGRPAEIINADAMQLYRGMDIGTAKLPPAERHGIPHHELDVLDVTDEASVAAYQVAARADVDRIQADGGVAVLVGGSGLYVSAVLFDLAFPGTDPALRAQLEREHEELGPGILLERLRALDPAAAATIDARNPRRLIRALEIASRSEVVTPSLPASPRAWRPSRILHLRRDREQLVSALHERAARMFEAGLVDEVAALREQGLEQGRTARGAIGYSQALEVLAGTATREHAVEATGIATRKYARRQVSWFRRYADAETLDVTGADRGDLSELARRIVP
ncbi:MULTISPECIES: tRNA (adenosine(37)-N6)-dimethylallyltransferase MiaA [unclassified Curtobacterium]|uniref:tRNA (adenosine(37)-N6)-dimethylallyltransferase MiaA n=1 Tax=Curtobacterium sp. MCBD17_026 TaxID=2175621 RepID=UPI0021AC432C|nr:MULTISPECIES: tRNA (adenosine(37)-N6)-dimethylallyltransferase MiaA [unclassified Curtobacterium]WIB71871.1 tRNA (adenosine(37)-N6)-dimethylallyltransferase MiaA [Curtobacterium sp. MCBD17_026]